MTSENAENEEVAQRWPRDGDRLFLEPAWGRGARVTTDSGERSYRLPMAYKRAGDLLVQQACSDLADRRNVIYPALFCYRQSIELFLKCLIGRFGGQSAERAPNTHNLAQLWERFERINSERGVVDSLGLEATGNLIMEMHAADERSDGFRYPTDRDGEPFSFGDRNLDLENLYEVMEGIVNLFECADLEFSAQDDRSP